MPKPSSKRMTVANTSFMVEKLGEDCGPLQYVRELVQNSIEACQRNPNGKGDILLSVIELDGMGPKLMIADTGDGMDPREMERHLNMLSSSSSLQGRGKNYGVGAKIAALTKNPHGLLYCSWKDGSGHMLWLHQDPETREYGLKRLDQGEGEPIFIETAERSLKPSLIKGHGTSVILMGDAADANTMKPKNGKTTTKWITHFLNSRYFEFPEGINIQAIEGKFDTDASGRLIVDTDKNRTIIGQKAYLDQNAESSGAVTLSNATAHWWILSESTSRQSHMWTGNGHVAALYQKELYEMTGGRQSISSLQEFGVSLGYQRVVIYVEPNAAQIPNITTDIARSRLMANNEGLPWAEWAYEFRQNMPAEIEALVDTVSASTNIDDHKDRIQQRLTELSGLFGNAGKPIGEAKSPGDRSTAPTEQREKRPPTDVVDMFARSRPSSGRRESFEMPIVRWLSVNDGTRQGSELRDRAARYVHTTNELHINRDFALFDRIAEHMQVRFGKRQGIRSLIETTMREWYSQSLVETIYGGIAAGRLVPWGTVNPLLSEESLTAAAFSGVYVQMQRITNSVSTKIGKINSPDRPEGRASNRSKRASPA